MTSRPPDPPLRPALTPQRDRALRALVIAAAAAIFLWRWWRTIQFPFGDFTLHWIFGRRFVLGGFLYATGMHTPYPPAWALACGPLAIGPMATVRALLYPFGLVPLALILWVMNRLTRDHLPLAGRQRFWMPALALLLASRFLIRELPESGVNLGIVALTWLGIYAWTRGRDALGGLSLGLAIALKCTPALFVLYFAWKRQWRMVRYSTLAAAAITLAPALWMGTHSYTHHMRYWLGTVQAGLAEPHPLRGALGDEEPSNLSLRPALARLLIAVPPDHKGHVAHPWHIQPLDLPPEAAATLIRGALALLLIAVALAMGRDLPNQRRDALPVVWECAAVGLLVLLYSPITWRQHCVAALPLLYLIARHRIARGRPAPLQRALILTYVTLVLLLDRGVVGRDLTILLDSYGVTAWALLALLIAAFQYRAAALKSAPHALDQTTRLHNPLPPSPIPQAHHATRSRISVIERTV